MNPIASPNSPNSVIRVEWRCRDEVGKENNSLLHCCLELVLIGKTESEILLASHIFPRYKLKEKKNELALEFFRGMRKFYDFKNPHYTLNTDESILLRRVGEGEYNLKIDDNESAAIIRVSPIFLTALRERQPPDEITKKFIAEVLDPMSLWADSHDKYVLKTCESLSNPPDSPAPAGAAADHRVDDSAVQYAHRVMDSGKVLWTAWSSPSDSAVHHASIASGAPEAPHVRLRLAANETEIEDILQAASVSGPKRPRSNEDVYLKATSEVLGEGLLQITLDQSGPDVKFPLNEESPCIVSHLDCLEENSQLKAGLEVVRQDNLAYMNKIYELNMELESIRAHKEAQQRLKRHTL